MTALARQAGAAFRSTTPVSVAPQHPCRRHGPDEFDDAVKVGVDAVENIDADLLVFGEVTVGNTTPAAAVIGRARGHPGDWVGPGMACRRGTPPPPPSTMSHESVMSPHSRHSGDWWPRAGSHGWRNRGGPSRGSRCCSTVSSPLPRLPCISRPRASTTCGPGTDPPHGHERQLDATGRNRCLRSIFDWVRSGAVIAIPIVQACGGRRSRHLRGVRARMSFTSGAPDPSSGGAHPADERALGMSVPWFPVVGAVIGP